MKCVNCILKDLVNEPLSVERMQQAVDGARTAVTVSGGGAYCTEHFFERIIKFTIENPEWTEPPKRV